MTESLRCLIDRLENHYDFQSEAGPLKLCAEWEALKKHLATSAEGWQPIATMASMDYVLLASPAHGLVIGAHVTGDVYHLVGVGTVTSESERPTHWRPLPDPPGGTK